MALNSEKSKQSRRNKDGQERRGQDLIDKLVAVRRVAKVVKGGRRFSFAVLVVVGDGKGRVGMGTGKALEVPDAMRKAVDDAKHNMFRVSMREGRTLHHDMIGRAGAGKVVLRAAPAGTGIIAGGPMRAVFETMGIQDVVAKSMGSQNPANMIRATFDALQRSSSPRKISSKRGMRVGGIVARRESTVQSSKVSTPAESNKE